MHKYFSCGAPYQKFLHHFDSGSEATSANYNQIGPLFYLLFPDAIYGVTIYNYGAPIFLCNPCIYCGLMEAGIYFLTNFVSVEQNRFFFFPSYSHFPFERYLVGMQQSKFGFRGNVQRQTESIQGPGGEILVRVHSRMAYVEVVSQLEQDIRPNVTNARQSFPIIAGA